MDGDVPSMGSPKTPGQIIPGGSRSDVADQTGSSHFAPISPPTWKPVQFHAGIGGALRKTGACFGGILSAAHDGSMRATLSTPAAMSPRTPRCITFPPTQCGGIKLRFGCECHHDLPLC